jgi:dienelactone hydrolase
MTSRVGDNQRSSLNRYKRKGVFMKTNYGMTLALVTILIAMFGSTVEAGITTKTIAYEDQGQSLQGYLAFDDAVKGRRPAVLVVHEWWGLNDYVRKRVEQLASLGYVAFAPDMYGKGRVTEHPNDSGEWATQVSKNTEFWRQRALAGLAALKNQPQADPSRIAAIGYCFGGSTVQQLAYSGADIRGIVSFHGALQKPPTNTAAVKSRILICQGGADPFVKPQQFQDYLTAMEKSGLDYEVIVYSGAKHAFTNPDADKKGMAPLKYSPSADRRSWADMKLFFDQIFSTK